MARGFVWLAVLALFAPVEAWGQSHFGMVDVLHAEPGYVQLNPDVSIFPGESMTLRVVGSVVSRHHFRKRRCKYFGLKCWYEQRSVAQVRDQEHFRVRIDVRSRDGSFRRTFLSGEGPVDGSQEIVVRYPVEGHSLTNPAELFGMLEFVGSTGAVPFHRAPCTGRPRYCSTGSLKLESVGVDVSERRQRIEDELEARKDRLDPVLVRSEVFADPLLIYRKEDRKQLQGVFDQFLSGQVNGAQGSPADRDRARAVVDVAKFAVGLHEDPEQVSSLNRTILNAYVALGDWSRIKDEGGASLVTARGDCREAQEGDAGPGNEACQSYAEILRLNAIAWFEQKARYSSTEIRVALGMLEQGIAALEMDDLEAECANHKDACELLGKLYVDGARMLTVIRTSAELRTAEKWLQEAIEIHRAVGRREE